MSNGYMCAPSGGWTKHADLYNPGHSQVIGREYQDVETKQPAKNRGAPTTAKHVEILGNTHLLVSNTLRVYVYGGGVEKRKSEAIA